jgi:hypothetical protein
MVLDEKGDISLHVPLVEGTVVLVRIGMVGGRQQISVQAVDAPARPHYHVVQGLLVEQFLQSRVHVVSIFDREHNSQHSLYSAAWRWLHHAESTVSRGST